MLPVNSGGHTAYQTFVLENLRKYYPDPSVFAKSTWDIIERFWNLDLSYTDELLRSKYSVFGPKPRTPNFYFNLHDKNSKRLQNKNNQFSIKNYLPIKYFFTGRYKYNIRLLLMSIIELRLP